MTKRLAFSRSNRRPGRVKSTKRRLSLDFGLLVKKVLSPPDVCFHFGNRVKLLTSEEVSREGVSVFFFHFNRPKHVRLTVRPAFSKTLNNDQQKKTFMEVVWKVQ